MKGEKDDSNNETRSLPNREAEQKAIEVRVRAERRAGQLLREMERSQGTRNDVITSVHAEPKLSEFQSAKQEANTKGE